MNLIRLIYASDATMEINLQNVKDILDASQRNNATLEITGILVVSGDRFLQVLEGQIQIVNNLYRKILFDSRHINCNIISYHLINERHFGAWSMRGVNLQNINPNLSEMLFRKYGKAGNHIIIPDDPFKAYSLLYDVYNFQK